MIHIFKSNQITGGGDDIRLNKGSGLIFNRLNKDYFYLVISKCL